MRSMQGSGTCGPDSATEKRFPFLIQVDNLTRSLLLLMVMSIVGIYARSFNYPFTEWDDPQYVTENTELGAIGWDQVKTQFSSNVAGNYHPITILSYSLEIRLFGKDPHVMHRTNVLFHVLNGLLVFLLLYRLIGEPRIAVLAALLFALHPMRVESVAWIAARKDLLMLFFTLLCLLAWMAWLRTGKALHYATAFLTFALACLSKGMAVAIVPSLFLIDVLWDRPLRQWKTWHEKIPFILGAVAFGVVAVLAQSDAKALNDAPGHRWHLLLAGLGNVTVYLAQQVVPVGLSAHYGYPEPVNGWPPWHIPALAACTLGGAALWWRSRPGRIFIFAMLFFLANIALVLHFIPVGYALRADRYTCVPGIGWALLVVVALRTLLERAGIKSKEALVVIASGYALVLGAMSFQRVPVWSSPLTVWDDILRHGSRASNMYMSRGLTLQRLERFNEALVDMDKAVELRPADQSIPVYHRAMLHLMLQHYDKAINDFATILAMGENPPGVVPNAVYAKMKLGRCDEVIADVDTYLDHVPGTIDLLNARSWCLFKLGRGREAIADVDRSFAMDSSYGAIHYLAALAELAGQDTIAACARLRKSAALTLADDEWRQQRDTLRAQLCAGTDPGVGEPHLAR